jgi:hypothetical protein
MPSNEIIVVEQLPVIKEQLHQIKAEAMAKVETALALVCTEDTVKEIKKTRAELSKDFKFWEDKRKAVKTAVMSPYEQFETVYKECITDVFKPADNELKNKISSVENELKEQKRSEVKAYFDEYLASKGIDFISFETANINVTLSASLKSLKEQAKAFIDRICDDLNLIDTQEFKDEILFYYKKVDGMCFLNVSKSIQLVTEKYKAIEAEKVKEEERKATEQAAAAAESKVDEATAPLAAPKVVEPFKPVPVSKFTFTVIASDKRLQELKDFLEREEFDYECV